MRKVLLLFLLLISACHPAAVLPGDGADVLLQEVAQDLDNQRFEAAMEKALLSLEIARASGEELGEVKAALKEYLAQMHHGRVTYPSRKKFLNFK